MTSARPHSISQLYLAAFGGVVFWSCASLVDSDARAACVQTGSNVDCAGNDFNGFRSPQSLTIQIRPNAFIQNEITNETIGLCPLSFPAIEAGAFSSVTNEGTISTGGVCGFGIAVDRNSSVFNLGTIRTADVIAYGITADENALVRNAGVITTERQGSGGVFGGAGSRIFNETGGRIATAGVGSSGVEAGGQSAVTNDGQIATRGDASHGIDAGPASAVVNAGNISTSANNSMGVRIAGGSLVNTGSIRSVLTGLAFALTPTVGVSIVGGTAEFTNTQSGSVTATHIGVRLGGTTAAQFSNNGRVEVFPAVQFDGTTSANGGAVVIAGNVGIDISNAGTILAHGGLPALRSLGPRVDLRNTGTIVGDVILSGGNDTIITSGVSSSINGAIDFGAGEDTLVFQGGGRLDRPIANLERLSQSGATALVIARDTTVSQQINVFGGGGILINSGTRLTAALTDNIGTIRGLGTLAGALDNGGVLAPGTATEKGTLAVTGGFRQFATGTLAVRLSPDGTSDRLVVGGPATLAGTLAVSYEVAPGGAVFHDGQRFDVLTPAGSALVSAGDFTIASPQLAFVDAKVVKTSSGGIAVEIDRRSYETAGISETQQAVGRMLDRRPAALAGTLDQLEVATPEGATALLAGLAPESPGGVQNLSLMALDRFTESLRGRVPGRRESGRFAWARGFASSGQSRSAASPATYDLHGAAGGFETHVGGLALGVAAARIEGDFARAANLADYEASLLGLTAHYAWSDVSLEAAIAYGTGSPEMRRERLTGGVSENLSTGLGVDLWSMSVTGSMSKALGPIAVTPHAGVAYHRAGLGASDERQALAVRTAAATAESMRARVGAGVAGAFGRFRPYGDLSVSVELLQRQPRIGAAVIGAAGSDFDLYGEARRRVAVEAEAGLLVALSASVDAYIAGAMTANDLLDGRRLSGGLTFRW